MLLSAEKCAEIVLGSVFEINGSLEKMLTNHWSRKEAFHNCSKSLPLPLENLFIPGCVSSNLFFKGWLRLIAHCTLWGACDWPQDVCCCSVDCLKDRDVVGYGEGGLVFFLWFHHHQHTSPIPLASLLPTLFFSCLNLSASDSSCLLFGSQRYPFLIYFLLFYSSFHFLLTLPVNLDYRFTPPVTFFRLFIAPPPSYFIKTALFHGCCSCVILPLRDRNICSPACLKTSGGREILVTAVRPRLSRSRAHGCV